VAIVTTAVMLVCCIQTLLTATLTTTTGSARCWSCSTSIHKET